jgi:hypothetical protein
MNAWFDVAAAAGVLVYLAVTLFWEGRRPLPPRTPEGTRPKSWSSPRRPCPSCGEPLPRFAAVCTRCHAVIHPIPMLAPTVLFFGFLLRHQIARAPATTMTLLIGLCGFGWLLLKLGSRPRRPETPQDTPARQEGRGRPTTRCS